LARKSLDGKGMNWIKTAICKIHETADDIIKELDTGVLPADKN
jgi:hypothetical protein